MPVEYTNETRESDIVVDVESLPGSSGSCREVTAIAKAPSALRRHELFDADGTRKPERVRFTPKKKSKAQAQNRRRAGGSQFDSQSEHSITEAEDDLHAVDQNM